MAVLLSFPITKSDYAPNTRLVDFQSELEKRGFRLICGRFGYRAIRKNTNNTPPQAA